MAADIATPAPRVRRYNAVAMLLHWAIAAMIVFQLAVGLWMAWALDAVDEATRFAGFEATQTHKAVGLTVLALSVLRLAWRFAHPAPRLPAGMPFLERVGAHFSHVAFYGLMIGLPLTGWAMSSVSPEFKALPTTYFDLFEVPHLPAEPLAAGLAAAGVPGEPGAAFAAMHMWLGYGAILLLLLHVAAALRHHIVLGDAVLARMVPFLRPRTPVVEPETPRAGTLGRVAAAGVLIAAAAGVVLVTLPHGDSADGPVVAAGAAPAAAMVSEAPRWSVVTEESRLGFAGLHSGVRFEGAFSEWTAEIAFDPDRLEQARIRVEIAVASAATGDMQYDGALTDGDWLAAAQHPMARFESESVRAGDAPGSYVADGTLTLRGVSAPVSLPFTLAIEGDRATVAGAAEIDRFAFGIGASADANAAWVAKTIEIPISVVALRGGGEG